MDDRRVVMLGGGLYRGDLMDIYAVPLVDQAIPRDSCLHRDKERITDLERNLEHNYTFLEKRFGFKEDDVKRR